MVLRSRAYGWYVLLVLASLNFLNYASRNVVVTMYPDLRSAFALDDIQLGWLSSSFMLAHAALNVPFGWIADRLDRRRVLALGAVVWSAANLGSAAADGFGLLLLSRVLAGFGTAACVPIANALLCDVFPPERKARTVSVLNVGLFLGGGAGIVLGNQPGFPWAFAAIALPGFILATACAALDVPPLRKGVMTGGHDGRGIADLKRGMVSVLSTRTMRWMIGGAIAAAFAAGGYLAWFADFLDRAKGFTPEEAMMTLGILAITGGLLGVVSGGAVADRLLRRWPFGRLLAIGLGFLGAVPCALVAIYWPRGPVFYTASWLLMFFINWYHGPMAAGVDDLVDDRRAALAQATFIFLMHLLGTSSAPVVVGALVGVAGIENVLVIPTASIACAAMAFLMACPSVKDDVARSC